MTEPATIAARYGVRPDQIREVPGGVANCAYLLGDDLFLRIPRTKEFEADLAKEVEVIPIARAAGVRTPAIVGYGSGSGDGDGIGIGIGIGTSYMVLEQVHATDLTQTRPPDDYWQDLGHQLAKLHQIRKPPPQIPHDNAGDPRPTVDQLATQGYLDPGTANWLMAWFDHLEPRIHHPNVLLHGDLALQNLMSNHTLIDWGDAAWGPPGMEFAKLPLDLVAATLPTYNGPEGIEAATLWYHLSWGVSGIPKPPRPNERHWTAPPTSRLLGVLRFFAAGPPEPWASLSQKVDHWH